MSGNYKTIKKKVEDKIIGGILVTIYNRRRVHKWYRTSEYVMERNRIREKEESEKNEYTETNE